MWDSYSEDKVRRRDYIKLIRLAIYVSVAAVIFAVVSNQIVNIFMNIQEFNNAFTKPIYFSLISGLILASLALARVNFQSRRSMVWYAFSTLTSMFRKVEFEPPKQVRYIDYQLPPRSFLLWQITKVLVAAPFFANLSFGMALQAASQGSNLDLGSLLITPSIPFFDIQSQPDLSQRMVFPAEIPLTIILPPLLSAIGIRVLVYLGLSGGVDILSRYTKDVSQGRPRFLSYIATIELISAAVLLWICANLLYSSDIDYNSKYFISVTLALGLAFLSFGLLDKNRSRIVIYPNRRHIYSRLVTVISLLTILALITIVNDSVAEAKSTEFLGGYVAQQIAVNKHLADLDNMESNILSLQPTQSGNLNDSMSFRNIVLWDQEAAQAKLKSALGQRNDVTLSDTGLVELGDKSYWAGSTSPSLPSDVRPSDRWFDQHFVYTESDAGIKLLDATSGNITETPNLFPQKQIYYGESGDSGLFDKVWSGYPIGPLANQGMDNFRYNGTGGVDLAPPLSWMFEPSFLFSYPDKTIHIMRYKDVYDRMRLLYPYFVYDFQFGNTFTSQFKKIQILPVTDGVRPLWLVPLILPLDTSHVPWASPFSLELTGYAVVDAYDGSIKIYVTGADPFSNLFYDSYRESGLVSRTVPDWLAKQITYPEEMFVWRTGKFNIYHVDNPTDFIQAKQFYDFAKDSGVSISPTYYQIDQHTSKPSLLLGVQLLQLHDSSSKDLVGYITVQNDLKNLGKLSFYPGTAFSASGLISPASAREVLSKDKEFQTLKLTIQGTPRIGQGLLYQVDTLQVYFIPIYGVASSTQVPEMAAVAVVAAVPINGLYYVGLGENADTAFSNFLKALQTQNSTTTTNIDLQSPDRSPIGTLLAKAQLANTHTSNFPTASDGANLKGGHKNDYVNMTREKTTFVSGSSGTYHCYMNERRSFTSIPCSNLTNLVQ